MARSFLHGWLILALASLTVIALNENETDTTQNPRENQERILKFSLRFFRNHWDRWVTQAELQRDGFSDEVGVPRVQFRVEQRLTESTGLPHLAAHLSAGTLLDGELVVLESEKYELVEREMSYLAASYTCRSLGMQLATPSTALFEWMHAWNTFSDAKPVDEVYVGISNIKSNFVRTEQGQMVMNGTTALDHHFLVCGVVYYLEWEEYKLKLHSCDSPRPFICEDNTGNRNRGGDPNAPKESVDVEKWIKSSDYSEDYFK